MMNPSLAAIVASRICHDLINPIGAVGNGLELLELTGLPNSPELALLKDSLIAATAKLKYFRVAFGQSDAASPMSFGEIEKLCSEMFERGRWKIEFAENLAPVNRPKAKVILLALLCIESTLPTGGKVQISTDALSATGKKNVALQEEWICVSKGGTRTNVASRLVHFTLLKDALSQQNRKLSVVFNEVGLTVSLKDSVDQHEI